MKTEKTNKKCKGCAYEKEYCILARINENNCEQDRKMIDEFNAQSYTEDHPEPLKAEMFYHKENDIISYEVEIVSYISFGKRSPAIRGKEEKSVRHLDSLWRFDTLAFKLANGRTLAAHEVGGELYK